MQQLDLQVAVRDHLRPHSHGPGDLERPVKTGQHRVVEVVALRLLEPQTLAVEAERSLEIRDAEPDVGRFQNGRSPLIATRSITRRRG